MQTLAKPISFVLAIVIYIAGHWLIVGTIPGVTTTGGGLNWLGLIIIAILGSLLSFILSGAYKDDPED